MSTPESPDAPDPRDDGRIESSEQAAQSEERTAASETGGSTEPTEGAESAGSTESPDVVPSRRVRHEARVKARQLRERQKRRDRRNRLILRYGILGAVVVIVGIVAITIATTIRTDGPAPQYAADDGIIIGPNLQVVAAPAVEPMPSPATEVPAASAAPAQTPQPAQPSSEPAPAEPAPQPAEPSSEPAPAEPAPQQAPAPEPSEAAPTAAPPADGAAPTEAAPGDGVAATAAPTSTATPVPTLTPEPGVVHIRIYADYICQSCAQFETTNIDTIEKWVATGAATLQIHPLAMFDNQSMGSKYSTRTANAAACVANFAPDSFFQVNEALFRKQPQAQSAGLSDDELFDLVKTAGAGSLDQIRGCITDRTYAGWVAAATKRAMNGPLPDTALGRITGTPTILVDGDPYEGRLDDQAAFLAFLTQHAGESYADSATPTPTPTPAAPAPAPTTEAPPAS